MDKARYRRKEAKPNKMNTLVGLEHEYRLEQDGAVDFRLLIHKLGLANAHLDPSDPNAYRLPCGASLTCDEREAELALPPTLLTGGFSLAVETRANEAYALLKQVLPAGIRIEGYSTHISISIDPTRREQVALLLACTFAPALMLLTDRQTSPGLLVRPRPKRIELGGEYVTGRRLRAALAVAVGSVRACLSGKNPPRLALQLALDHSRYGWYVDRRAFGPDLYSEGRQARLRLADGGTITAQEQLEASWEIARETITGLADETDLEPADKMIAGVEPLPIEGPDEERIENSHQAPIEPSIYGTILGPRVRPGYELAPVMVSWAVCVFVIVNPNDSRRAFACVPGQDLERFLGQLESGMLDALICDYLNRPATGQTLNQYDQSMKFGLYDDLGARRNLMAPELEIWAKRWRRLVIARQMNMPLRRNVVNPISRVFTSVMERTLNYG
ncbi:MAG TPA: hypothetical protein VLX61_11990 [Anaerolineales bacterium]|nr:hypothetical protein [Anaerolineales bacterium]